MAASVFRLGEADFNALTRMIFETHTHSRRVYDRKGSELHYLERNGQGGPRLGACSVQDFRSWCIRGRAHTRPASHEETQRDWTDIRARPGNDEKPLKGKRRLR